MLRKILMLTTFLTPILGFAQGAPQWRNITIDGSSAMVQFVQPASIEFARANKIGVTVNSNGSKIGYDCAIKKTCQIGMTSADLSAEDSKNLVISKAAFDGVGIVVSKNVLVDGITSKQLSDIYHGVITNWQELGGPNEKIEVFQRRENSSIRDLFDHLFKVDSSASTLDSNEQVVNRMKVTKSAITYVSLGRAYADGGKNLKLLKIDGIDPTPENVKTSTYKFKRALYLVRHKDFANDQVLADLTEKIMASRAGLFPKLGLILP